MSDGQGAGAMRFASLGSGSEGNALLIEASDGTTTTRVLLDCGFSVKEIEKRLARLALATDDLDAVLITHEHADHIGGGLTLARRTGIPIFMSWGTAQATAALSTDLDLQLCKCGEVFEVGDLQILPYTVPHDAREPLQFTFTNGCRRLGVLTDIGIGTAHVTAVLGGCDALMLECNHDRQMLAQSQYPASLKARIGGARGHLANDAAAAILASLDRSKLRRLVAAHLSRQNNSEQLVRAALAEVGGAEKLEIVIANQEHGFSWLAV
jgi:phosphoribosyl 1,2-cyclic phosphodiesterase